MTAKAVIVIGGGASGMTAAGRAAEMGTNVLLLEKTNRPGNKLRLTGNYRCNLTNSAELDDFVSMYGPSGRFLYHAFHLFFREDLLDLLWRYGVETRSEEDGRIFPVSGHAEDVVRALEQYMADGGVRLEANSRVTDILVSRRRVTGVKTETKTYPAVAVVLATGGASYPETGSSGDGYRLAGALGHEIVSLRPALVPLVVYEADLAKSMMGASLRLAKLTFTQNSVQVGSRPAPNRGVQAQHKVPEAKLATCAGELTFTHFGLSGPAVLRVSLAVVEALEKGPVSVCIDLFPEMNDQELRQRLQDEFDRFGKRGARHILASLVPKKMVDSLIKIAEISPDREGHQITAGERERLVSVLKNLRFNIKGSLPLASAMVTAGGVSLKEIDPKTMASRLIKGLYFCGEVVDLSADTGGYNLQAAFSTGYLAGEEAARGKDTGR